MKRRERMTNRAALAQKEGGILQKEETGDQVYTKRGRKRREESDLDINELGRVEQDGGIWD